MSKRPAEESIYEDNNAGSKRARTVEAEQQLITSPANGRQKTNHAASVTTTTTLPERLAAAAAATANAGGTDVEESGDEDLSDGDDDRDDDDLNGDESAFAAPTRQSAPIDGYSDLYLDTIDRKVLDFDFEKLCSVTLSNINVYACLVCGRYFQGRGAKSPAYFHALEVDHHVYVNMLTKKVYVLPEGYEVTSKSLDDIKFVVDPRLPRDDVLRLDKEAKESYDLSQKKYRVGYVGMNNIKANDYFNVVIQALAHVPPLRNFFMLEDLSARPALIQRFSILVRKLWNTRAFKTHVSPHELLQQISRQSQKKFDLLHQSDPAEFLSWFLNNLHLGLGGSKTKPGTSIIQKVFQGQVRIESQEITSKADPSNRLRFEDTASTTTSTRYLMLSLDLPAAPLFQDEVERNIIPQIPLTTILGKYDGVRSQEIAEARRRYRLVHPLPPYLIFHIKRFTMNKFVQERNPTIVTFAPRGLDMGPYTEPNPAMHPPGEPIIYDLVANVTHESVKFRDDSVEGEAERKVWRCQVRDRARDDWFEIQDLYVDRVAAETLFARESYLMIWERRRTAATSVTTKQR